MEDNSLPTEQSTNTSSTKLYPNFFSHLERIPNAGRHDRPKLRTKLECLLSWFERMSRNASSAHWTMSSWLRADACWMSFFVFNHAYSMGEKS
ncbi:MAG: hypothetical protein CSA75_05160 [Sorangium cellulosum]|nr:MAG: hypothetical protein CSA75_05160 [Sorangium cellulosum]